MTKHYSLLDQFDRAFPSAVGFDRTFDILNHATDALLTANNTFPPYSLVKLDDYNYQVELAVAGYSEADLDVTSEKNLLTIVGTKTGKDDRQYVVRGIAGRNFTRKFVLADTIVVREVTLVNGILSVRLENVIPEEQKPRKLQINKPQSVVVDQQPELLTEQ